jgi:hypothetical protein
MQNTQKLFLFFLTLYVLCDQADSSNYVWVEQVLSTVFRLKFSDGSAFNLHPEFAFIQILRGFKSLDLTCQTGFWSNNTLFAWDEFSSRKIRE